MATEIKIITEETEVVFEKYEELSYYDPKTEYVDLYVKDEYAGQIEVFTDRENGNREYICINYEIIYLDTICNIAPENNVDEFETTEYCPFCDTEQTITKVAQPCPNPDCNRILVACSMCKVPTEQGVRCGGCKNGSLFELAEDSDFEILQD